MQVAYMPPKPPIASCSPALDLLLTMALAAAQAFLPLASNAGSLASKSCQACTSGLSAGAMAAVSGEQQRRGWKFAASARQIAKDAAPTRAILWWEIAGEARGGATVHARP